MRHHVNKMKVSQTEMMSMKMEQGKSIIFVVAYFLLVQLHLRFQLTVLAKVLLDIKD